MQFCLVFLLQFLAVLEQQMLYYKILMLILTVLVRYERMYVQKNLTRMTKKIKKIYVFVLKPSIHFCSYPNTCFCSERMCLRTCLLKTFNVFFHVSLSHLYDDVAILWTV